MRKSLRDKRILLRVTGQEREQIKSEALLRGLSVNDYLCAVALGYQTEDQLALQQELGELRQRMDALENGGRHAARR